MTDKLRETIGAIAKENQEYTMNLSTRDIQEMIGEKLGFVPSTSTIAKILREFGFETKYEGRHAWVYRHNPPKGEE